VYGVLVLQCSSCIHQVDSSGVAADAVIAMVGRGSGVLFYADSTITKLHTQHASAWLYGCASMKHASACLPPAMGL
jgi:hypothetical protein